MPLPTVPTFAPLSQIPSAALNAVFRAAYAEPVLVLSMANARLTGATYDDAVGYITFPDGVDSTVVFGIELPIGRKITTVSFQLRDAGATKEINCAILVGALGSSSSPASSLSSGTAGDEVVTLSGLAVEIEEGKSYWLRLSPPNNADDKFLYAISVTHEPL